MALPATVSDSSIARFQRLVGVVNLALAVICLALPAVRASVGDGMALVLAVGLLAGAALMFVVARCFDPRRRAAIALPNDGRRPLGAQRLAAA